VKQYNHAKVNIELQFPPTHFAPFAGPLSFSFSISMTRAVPHEDIILRSGADDTFRNAAELCTRLVPGWSTVEASAVTVTVISGGITNSLLKVRRLEKEDGRCVRARPDLTSLCLLPFSCCRLPVTPSCCASSASTRSTSLTGSAS
jgi:broad specificity phosphatase PhoE